MLAPIVLFVYNRPLHTLQTLESLYQNTLAQDSVLWIFADGARENTSETEHQKIKEVRLVIRQKKWCKEVHILESEKNKGLMNSIIEGVSLIVHQYGKIIVLEDDLVLSPYFLTYINQALNLYEHVEEVMHINGYFFPIPKPLDTVFFYNVPNPWGWATWSRAWQHFNPNIEDLWKKINSPSLLYSYDLEGGGSFSQTLLNNLNGKQQTWAIRWYASIFLKKGFCLNPPVSLAQNIGFDGSGEHCNPTALFQIPKLSETIEVKKIPLKENLYIRRKMRFFYLYDGFGWRDKMRHHLNRIKKALYPFIPQWLLKIWQKFKKKISL